MTTRVSRRALFIGLTSALLLGVGLVWWRYMAVSDPVHQFPVTLEVQSDQLHETAILPTLDSPIPEQKSAIWCASFQYAWNRLKTEVVGGPIRLAEGQDVADRLNRAEQSETDVDPVSVFAAAGLVDDGIVDQIRQEMTRRFPNVPTPTLDAQPGGAVAYSYLAVSAQYDLPYFENDRPFLFTDSAGRQTRVGSFGVRTQDAFAYHRLREQVEILYRSGSVSEFDFSEFVLDLCKTSRPYQIVIARVSRKTTLAETWADVEQKISGWDRIDGFRSRLGPNDTLLVPSMAWRIDHRFRELGGPDKKLLNSKVEGLYLYTAMQTIQFRLDRNGAELAAESKLALKPIASDYLVNRPFLICLKKRGAKHPVFIAWIENAELLEKK